MADDIDRANDLAEAWNAFVIAHHNGEIPEGDPGECEECGYYFERLVGGLCARCREETNASRR